MNKFTQALTRGAKDIRKERAQRVSKSALIAQMQLVQDIESELMKVEDKLDAMMDMSPDNRYSLKVGEDFDASNWVKEYQELHVKRLNLKVELEVAESNKKDLFDDAE